MLSDSVMVLMAASRLPGAAVAYFGCGWVDWVGAPLVFESSDPVDDLISSVEIAMLLFLSYWICILQCTISFISSSMVTSFSYNDTFI